MQAPICKVAGMVVSTEIREEPGLGMSSGETFIYTDIILNISESAYNNPSDATIYSEADSIYFNCKAALGQQTYQLQGGSKKPEIGECLAFKTEYLADGNFRSGNWMYDIKTIDGKFCP
jgi:hypothetical protein